MNASEPIKLSVLEAIRSVTGLTPNPTSWGFVYEPNAIAIESIAKTKPSVIISLYGRPGSYGEAEAEQLQLREGRPSFSRITLTSEADVSRAMPFIRRAFSLRERRRWRGGGPRQGGQR